METKIYSAGKRGDKVRSDCYVELSPVGSGIEIEVKSKVSAMYSKALNQQLKSLADYFDLKNVKIYLEDFGALQPTIAARFEQAVKLMLPQITKEYLPEFHPDNLYGTTKDKLRRSRLYLPGNEPKFYPNAGLHRPDGVILDLEDSVAPTEKVSARYLVRNTLRAINFYNAERMVRINQLPMGLEDLDYIIPHNVNVVLIPKVESADQIKQVEEKVLELKMKHNLKNDVYFMPIIESALGVMKAYEIASASKYNCSLAIGLEDYTADLGTQRTDEGKESIFARSMLINAAKAAGIQPIDTVYSDVSNMDGLRDSVIEAKSLGFEGKGCIHPRQIKVIHEAFAPEEKEIEKAKKIVLAFDDATAKGLGVVSLGSKMIDAPVVKRALNTIKLAKLNNLLPENWKEIN